MDLPIVTIIVTTYDPGDGSRTKYLVDTIDSLSKNLRYTGTIKFIITDDSTEENHEKNVDVARQIVLNDWGDCTIINTNRKGVGFAKNNALKLAFNTSPYVLLMEDDWKLKEPFDLIKHVEVLNEHPEFSMVRFGYLGGTFDASYVDLGPFKSYWKLHRGSGVYIYSGQIGLRSKKFYDGIGWHLEDISPGEEELDMCKRFNACEDCGDILWPAEYGCTLNAGPFLNIGLGNSMNDVIPHD